ncbi:MAG TPA: outer membrane lipoprotein carrier protein LolA [Nitrospinota bacterium]|nr:outer membrane lipoprotein carrier protein LolA [Nitrospinota bacterium]
MKTLFLVLFLLPVLPVDSLVSMAEEKVGLNNKQVINKVEKAIGEINSLSAKFSQISITRGFGVAGETNGRLILKKPSMMRWNYETPKGMSIVVNGSRLWFYDPEDKSVYYEDFTGNFHSISPATFLSGEVLISELFNIDLVPGKKNDKLEHIMLRLIPKKPQRSIKGVLLKVDKNTFKLMQTTFVDYLGNKNQITYTDVKIGLEIDCSRFNFIAPEGTITKSFPNTQSLQ